MNMFLGLSPFGLLLSAFVSVSIKSFKLGNLRGPGVGGLHQDFLEIDFLVVSHREK